MSENAAWSETPLRPFAAAVLASTVESEMASNGLYNEILKRAGAHYILHGMARHEGAAIGRLSLFRSAAGRPFGLREIAALSSVMRYVARGLALVGVHVVRKQPACLRFVNAMSALPLSPQQREIALLIARGGTNRDIAARLSVSINTVAYHIKQLFYKLRVHDRAGLLARINSTVACVEGEGACAVRIGIDPDARAHPCTKTFPSTSTASSSRAAAAASRT